MIDTARGKVPVRGVEYQIIMTDKKEARLDSYCAGRKDDKIYKGLGISELREYNITGLTPDKKFYFNVIAITPDAKKIPYHSVEMIIYS